MICLHCPLGVVHLDVSKQVIVLSAVLGSHINWWRSQFTVAVSPGFLPLGMAVPPLITGTGHSETFMEHMQRRTRCTSV